MNKICTSIEQSKKLIELGIDVNTADIIYNIFGVSYVRHDTPIDKYHTPAWSLTALIKMLPDKITIDNETYYPFFNKKGIAFRGPISWDGQKSKSFEMDDILDAAFEMIVWLKENNKL